MNLAQIDEAMRTENRIPQQASESLRVYTSFALVSRSLSDSGLADCTAGDWTIWTPDSGLGRGTTAHEQDDLRLLAANRLEALKGKRRGQHSIRINDQWRMGLQADYDLEEARKAARSDLKKVENIAA